MMPFMLRTTWEPVGASCLDGLVTGLREEISYFILATLLE